MKSGGLRFSGPASYQFKDMTGARFGFLVVLSYAGQAEGRGALWLCRCCCGRKIKVKGNRLRRGKIRSCGCKRYQLSAAAKGQTGVTSLPEYRIWNAMVIRCCNPKVKGYSRYGGKGIEVCRRWRKFSTFYADMGPRPSARHSLDRFPDQRGNYEPGNVRWATLKEQGRNRSDNRLIEWRGEILPMVEWAERLNIPYHTLKRRLNKWPTERAFTQPMRYRKHG